MPSPSTIYKVFIASPSRLNDIRVLFRDTLHSYNETDALQRGVQFIPVGWEETLGGVGRAQEMINKDLVDCDYFVLVLHDRWGTPPSKSEGKFTSGTEEEFAVAMDCYNDSDKPMAELAVFFKAVSERQLSDPGQQLTQVLNFKKRLEESKDIFFHSFDESRAFEKRLRAHLANWLRIHEGNGLIEGDVGNSTEVIKLSRYDDLTNGNEELRAVLELVEKNHHVEAELAFARLVTKDNNPLVLAHYARYLRKIGQLARAIEIANEAVKQASKQGEMAVIAFATHQKARILEESSKLDDAVDSFRTAIVCYEMVNDPKGAAKTSRSLGKVLKKTARLDEAQSVLEKSMKFYEQANDLSGKAGAYGYLGVILKERGLFKEAEESHFEALRIHEEKGNRHAIAIVYGNLGTVSRLQGRYQQSCEYHTEALEVHKEFKDYKGMCRELSNIGTSKRYLGNLDSSMEFHLKSLELSIEIGNQHGMAIQYGCMAQIHAIRNQFREAEELHLKSLAISKEMNDLQGISIQLRNLGVIYRLMKNYDKAEEMLNLGLESDVKRGFVFGVGKSKLELAKLLIEQDRKEHAKFLLHEANDSFIKASAIPEKNITKKLLKALDVSDQEKLEQLLQQYLY